MGAIWTIIIVWIVFFLFLLGFLILLEKYLDFMDKGKE